MEQEKAVVTIESRCRCAATNNDAPSASAVAYEAAVAAYTTGPAVTEYEVDLLASAADYVSMTVAVRRPSGWPPWRTRFPDRARQWLAAHLRPVALAHRQPAAQGRAGLSRSLWQEAGAFRGRPRKAPDAFLGVHHVYAAVY